MEKSEIRHQMLSIREHQNPEELAEKSKRIVEHIRSLEEYLNAKCVAIYAPIRGEVDLLRLKDDGKKIVYPKVISMANSSMDFFEEGTHLVETAFSLWEPTGAYVSKNDIDLILIPGLAFTKTGKRIGYGKGFYDLFLKDFSGSMIGVAYGFQIVEEFATHDQDIRIPQVVTEEGTICTQP